MFNVLIKIIIIAIVKPLAKMSGLSNKELLSLKTSKANIL